MTIHLESSRRPRNLIINISSGPKREFSGGASPLLSTRGDVKGVVTPVVSTFPVAAKGVSADVGGRRPRQEFSGGASPLIYVG
eukprot:1195235-Prorocentrum_minimum.AAC.9